MKFKNALYVVFVVSLLLGHGGSARAFTQSSAAAAWQSYKQQFFYVINGNEGYFRNQQGVGYTTTTYQMAYDIEAAVDAQDVTAVNDTINGFVAQYGTNAASWDVAEDDNMEFALMFARAYQLTGNSSQLAMAKSNFDTSYNRAWDSANGGGLMRIEPGVKSAQVNAPGCLAAYLIYQSGGGGAYLTKSQGIYNWMLANVWNSSTGQVNATPGDATNPLSSRCVLLRRLLPLPRISRECDARGKLREEYLGNWDAGLWAGLLSWRSQRRQPSMAGEIRIRSRVPARLL